MKLYKVSPLDKNLPFNTNLKIKIDLQIDDIWFRKHCYKHNYSLEIYKEKTRNK